MTDHTLHQYEVLHNRLSELEVLPVGYNPVESESVFHNLLVESAVYHHPYHHRKTDQRGERTDVIFAITFSFCSSVFFLNQIAALTFYILLRRYHFFPFSYRSFCHNRVSPFDIRQSELMKCFLRVSIS